MRDFHADTQKRGSQRIATLRNVNVSCLRRNGQMGIAEKLASCTCHEVHSTNHQNIDGSKSRFHAVCWISRSCTVVVGRYCSPRCLAHRLDPGPLGLLTESFYRKSVTVSARALHLVNPIDHRQQPFLQTDLETRNKLRIDRDILARAGVRRVDEDKARESLRVSRSKPGQFEKIEFRTCLRGPAIELHPGYDVITRI
jgi:hypothetical protein